MTIKHEKNSSRIRNAIRVSSAIVMLTVVLLAFNQCVVDKSSSSKLKTSLNSGVGGSAGDIATDKDLPDGLTMPPINSPTSESANDELDIGIKNFEQIYLSMSAATGVSVTYDSSLVVNYKSISGQLPVDNDIKSFLPNNQIAVTKMASEFCQRLLEDAALRTVVWPTINFATAPKTLFTAANKQIIINQSIDRFMPPLDEETKKLTYAELSDLFEILLKDSDINTSVTSRTVAKGMCITTLSSAHATIL